MDDEHKESVSASSSADQERRGSSNQQMDQNVNGEHGEGKDEVDENSLESVSSAVRHELKKKQTLQEDVKLLKNRTKHLRREYALAQQKIAETKQRTEQIYKQKARREEKLRERKEREMREQKARKARAGTNDVKNSERLKHKRVQQELLEEKKAGTKEVVMIKSKIKKDLEIRQEEDLKAKQTKRQQVQKQLHDAQVARQKREEVRTRIRMERWVDDVWLSCDVFCSVAHLTGKLESRLLRYGVVWCGWHVCSMFCRTLDVQV
jgi:hypothetical protein